MDFDFKLPGLGKPASSRPQRVAEAIRQELTLLLQRDAGDPRLRGASVGRVEVSPDLRVAKLHITAENPADRKRIMEGMERARGYFRSHLARVLNLRCTPELLLYYDNLAEEAGRVEDLLTALAQERREHGGDRTDSHA